VLDACPELRRIEHWESCVPPWRRSGRYPVTFWTAR
jgi:hypothetical protein